MNGSSVVWWSESVVVIQSLAVNVVPERVIPVKPAGTEVMVRVITSVPLVVELLPTEAELAPPVVNPVEILVKLVTNVPLEFGVELPLKLLVELMGKFPRELIVEVEEEIPIKVVVKSPVELTIILLAVILIDLPLEMGPVELCDKTTLVKPAGIVNVRFAKLMVSIPILVPLGPEAVDVSTTLVMFTSIGRVRPDSSTKSASKLE